MEPKITLLSHTAYPLEMLYLASAILENPSMPYQKPEEIRMLLYTELSHHLKSEHKQFILDKMRELIKDDSNLLNDSIQFIFSIESVNYEVWNSLDADLQHFFLDNHKNRAIWITSVNDLRHFYKLGGINIKQLVTNACNEILEKVDPYLYQLLTAE